MDAMVRELTDALERTQHEGQRTRMLGELAGSIDLDEVLTRVLEAAGAIDGVDAALVTVAAPPGGEPIVAALGLSADGGRAPGRARPAGRTRGARDLDVVRVRAGGRGRRRRGDPLRRRRAAAGRDGPLGLLTVFTRALDTTFGEAQVSELEELALRAGPAIENARRFREARQLADLDALTGLHNRRYFHETLAREVARAHRYNRNLALIIFDLDDFKAINDRIGHLAGDARAGGGGGAHPSRSSARRTSRAASAATSSRSSSRSRGSGTRTSSTRGCGPRSRRSPSARPAR